MTRKIKIKMIVLTTNIIRKSIAIPLILLVSNCLFNDLCNQIRGRGVRATTIDKV